MQPRIEKCVKAMMGWIFRLVANSSATLTVFYDIYSDEEKAQDPEKGNTGLFFLRGNPDAPFAVIAPGGGFSDVGSLHEGFPYATEINSRGYNAFVLAYRIGDGSRATEDLVSAINFIISHADELGVSPEGYSLWGSSAGARMVASMGTLGGSSFGYDSMPPASAIITAYTGHTGYSSTDPATMAVVGERDSIVSTSVMQDRLSAMAEAGIDTECIIYPDMMHGFGSGVGTEAEGWIQNAVTFWEEHI